ncbi:MAG: hypothetical protein GY716_13360 [bacterium]|nr:hypothetical protein [bacterium]
MHAELGHDGACLTVGVDSIRRMRQPRTATTRRATTVLQSRRALPGERSLEAHGILFRFETVPAIPELPQPTPAAVDAAIDGIGAARKLLVDTLELPDAEIGEVLLTELGDRVDGYVVPAFAYAHHGFQRIVLDVTPRSGAAGARRAAAHQFSHAVVHALSPGLPVEWAEAFATWVAQTVEGQPDEFTLAGYDDRLEHMHLGLFEPGLRFAAGNGLWFTFLEQDYGMPAIRLTLEELAKGTDAATALDLAIRRVSTDDLATALREFHVWNLLVGPRADRRHFPFAAQLDGPWFASDDVGLPALSVQSNAAVGPFGAAHVLLRPEAQDGGMTIQFEGDFAAEWACDVLLVSDSGEQRRVPVDVSPEGRGGVTVPLDGLKEAVLLVRHLGGGEGPQRYTYAVDHEKAYPFELASLEAFNFDERDASVIVQWETLAERDLIGFNVLRYRDPAGPATTINPIWIPALGDLAQPTAYHFLDETAETGVSYTYRIQGITRDGLAGLSEPVSLALAPRR